ncbi:hypothetical protein PybrP1_010934, partial [[Pythium] brassicae (nom. inval.)]
MDFSTSVVSMSEIEEYKKLRHHPLVDSFYSLSVDYDPHHRLNWNLDSDEDVSDTDSHCDVEAIEALIAGGA